MENSLSQIEQFRNAKQTLKMAGLTDAEVSNAVLTRSYLRLEQPLSATSSVFNFPVLNNQTGSGVAIRPNEVRLNQQDCFFASSVAFYLAATTGATQTGFQLLTYPNAIAFPTGATGLYSVYNGNLSVNANNSVIIPKYPMSNFLYINQTQLINAAAGNNISQFDPTQKPNWTPSLNFIGTKNYVVNLNLNGTIGTIDANTVGVFIFFGILAQNVTIMS